MNVSCSIPITKKYVQVFDNALDGTTGKDVAKMLWLRSPSSEVWLERRTEYSRSLALMSMVGYVLGLGDRHPSNLMLDRLSGKIVHIDFGDCFDVTVLREKFPERVPFRLTRMLVNAMEVSGVEGTYRGVCESVLRILRSNSDSVMTMLEAFVHDPLINWGGMTKNTEGEEEGGEEGGGEEIEGKGGKGGNGGKEGTGKVDPGNDGGGESNLSTRGKREEETLALKRSMENAMEEERIKDLKRRGGISHHKRRLLPGERRRGVGDEMREKVGAEMREEGEEGEEVEEMQKETLNERAVSVLARVQEKLTGRDQIAYRIGAKKILTGTTAGSDQSTSGGSAGGDAGGGSHQGQDQDVEDGDSSSNNEGMSSTLLEEPMAIAEQVDKLIIEAQSHENLSQLFIGWCPFW